MKQITVGEMIHSLMALRSLSAKDRDFVLMCFTASVGGFNTSLIESDNVDRIDELYSEHC